MEQIINSMFYHLTSLVSKAVSSIFRPKDGKHGDSLGEVVGRLEQASAAITEICNISGIPSASVGILHHGKVIFRENFGYRDVATKQPPTSDTQYCIGSLTKSFTSLCLANIFAEHHEFDWSSPLRDILPEYVPKDTRLHGLVTIADFLSHRTGLFGDMSTAIQGDMEVLLPPEELISTVADLETVSSFRQSWNYNNWGYSIASRVIERLSGQSYHDFVTKAVLQPLGLENTTTRPNLDDQGNTATPYATLEDGTPHQLPMKFPLADSLFEAAGGMFSTVNDLLKYIQAVLAAERDPTSTQLHSMRLLLSNQIPLDQVSREYRFYGLGWIRTLLPGVVGLQGDNAELFDWNELPILGQGSPARTAYYHQGSSFGYCSAAFMFPESESGVVVLTNSMALNDAADWIAQGYVSALFQNNEDDRYVQLAKESRKRKLANVADIQTIYNQIRKDHQHGAARPLDTYTGIYRNNLGNFVIEVREHEHDGDILTMAFQGKQSQVYNLRHLQDDTFEWALTYDESARRARFAIWDPEYFKVRFHLSSEGLVSSVSWAKWTDGPPKGLTLYPKVVAGS